MSINWRIAILAATAFLLVAACSPAAAPQPAKEAQQKVKIKVGWTAPSASMATPHIAYKAGLFEKNGLDVELVQLQNATVLVSALLSGDVDFGDTTGSTVIQAAAAGGDTVIILGVVDTPTFSLIVKPTIKKFEDLKGKTVGITRVGTATDYAIRSALKTWKLEADKEVVLRGIGGIGDILTALLAGGIDAGVLSSPSDLKAKSAGFVEMADLGSMGITYPNNVVGTTRTKIKNSEDLVRKYVKAYVEGMHKYKTDKEFSMKVIGDFTQTTDKAQLEDAYTRYQGYIQAKPVLNPIGLEAVIAELTPSNPSLKGAKPEQFLDMKFVNELESSGFLKNLYGTK